MLVWSPWTAPEMLRPRDKNFKEAEIIAKEIKKEVKEKEQITCSVGIGPNKLVAKIASDHEKPDGLTIVKPDKVKQFLYPLEVRKLYGVGRKTEEVLKNLKMRVFIF